MNLFNDSNTIPPSSSSKNQAISFGNQTLDHADIETGTANALKKNPGVATKGTSEVQLETNNEGIANDPSQAEIASLGLDTHKYTLRQISDKQNIPFTASIKSETDTHFYLKVRGAKFRKNENPLIKVLKSDLPPGVSIGDGIKVKWENGLPAFSKSQFTIAIDKISEIFSNPKRNKR